MSLKNSSDVFYLLSPYNYTTTTAIGEIKVMWLLSMHLFPYIIILIVRNNIYSNRGSKQGMCIIVYYYNNTISTKIERNA